MPIERQILLIGENGRVHHCARVEVAPKADGTVDLTPADGEHWHTAWVAPKP